MGAEKISTRNGDQVVNKLVELVIAVVVLLLSFSL